VGQKPPTKIPSYAPHRRENYLVGEDRQNGSNAENRSKQKGEPLTSAQGALLALRDRSGLRLVGIPV
jgi:hypothetical protein